jgi:hypothetical protein
MRKTLFVLALVLFFCSVSRGQCNGNPGSGWSADSSSLTIQPTVSGGQGVGLLYFSQSVCEANPFYLASAFALTGPGADYFSLSTSSQSGATGQPCGYGGIISTGSCYIAIIYTPPSSAIEFATLFINSAEVSLTGLPYSSSGSSNYYKYVFFENQTTSNAGGRCYYAPEGSCVYGWIDWTISSQPEAEETNCSPGCIIAWSNPLTGPPPNRGGTGSYLELDNSVCSEGGQIASSYYLGAVNGSNVNWTVAENPNGGVLGFVGTFANIPSWTAVNFDGSVSPFSGGVIQISGNISGSTGNCAGDNGIGFQAYQFPSLGTADISINFTSQPGSLNQAESLTMSLQENSNFTVTATGTVQGPPTPCGPLTFTLDSGIALGNLYGLNGTFTDAQGNQGQMSIGLFLVTPFIVSGQRLAQYGYTTSGSESGIPVQVWSFDYTATSACAADPAIGQGVAYSRHRELRPRPRPRGRDFDLKDFWQKYQNARATKDRGNA